MSLLPRDLTIVISLTYGLAKKQKNCCVKNLGCIIGIKSINEGMFPYTEEGMYGFFFYNYIGVQVQG